MNGEHMQHLVTRRRVLISGTTAAASVVFLGLGSIASATSVKKPRFQSTGFKRVRFTPHVGSTVELRLVGGRTVRAKLAAVEDLSATALRRLAGSQDAYVLRFRAPSSLRIGQATIGVRHPIFGSERLFVTPSTRTRQYQDYVAVVNRLMR